MKLTFLGTGTSFGVPQLGCHCAVCHSADPRDRRTRVGAVVETDGGTRLLIDTPPELRLQLLSTGIESVDAVLYTHEHADHTHGIDDLRAISMRRGAALPIYGPRETVEHLAQRFPYIFDDSIRPLPGTSLPRATPHVVEPWQHFRIDDAAITALPVLHGRLPILAYRIGDVGYITDAKRIPDDVTDRLRGVRVLVVNALFRTEHPTHFSIPEAVRLAADVGAERTYLTHLTHDNFHADLAAELPAGVAPAYDGLTVLVD